MSNYTGHKYDSRREYNGLTVRKAFVITYFFGLALSAFEYIISPHPHYAKLYGIFPAISVLSYTFTLLELFSYCFIILFFLVFAYTAAARQSIRFLVITPYRIMTLLAWVFLLNLICSIFLGLALGNDDFFNMLRTVTLLLSYVVLYYYRWDLFRYRAILYLLMCSIGVYFSLYVFLGYVFGPDSLPVLSHFPYWIYNEGLWFGLYMAVFALCYHLSKIIFFRISIFSALIVFISLVAIIIRIENKPILFAAAVAIFVIFSIQSFVYKRHFSKTIVLIFLSMIGLSITFSSAEIRGDLFSTFAERFYKINVSAEEMSQASVLDVIRLAEHVQVGGGQDVSGGRFDLWRGYTSEAAKYPLVTPNFGRQPSVYVSAIGREIEFPPHNSIVHYIYYAGFPAGISLLLLMVLFVKKGWSNIKTRKSGGGQYSKIYQSIALYSFIISIICVELVGGPIHSSVVFSWYYWSVIVVFFASVESVKKEGTAVKVA